MSLRCLKNERRCLDSAWRLILLLLVVGLAGGCKNRLDTLYGYELGKAAEAVYGRDYNTDNLIVVFSNVTSLCSLISDNSPPTEDGDWVVSAWALSQGEQTSGGYFAVVENGEMVEHKAVEASVFFDELPSEIDASEGEEAKGKVTIRFDDDNVVETKFKAEYCYGPLLNGLQ